MVLTVGRMEEQPKLTLTLLGNVPGRVVGPAGVADFEAELRCAWEVGRDPWPGVNLPAEVFIRHLAQRVPVASAGHSLTQLIDQLALGDLYLACACIHQMPSSIDALESHYLAKLPTLLRYLNQPPMVLDDICQAVRIHLLLGTPEAGPQLAEYSGRGALLSWIRVVAVRMALKQRASTREIPTENVLAAIEALPAPGPDAEGEFIRHRYRREFREALLEAFALLSSEQRYRLRLHFIDQLSTTEMSVLFGVNQSTVSRWLKSARQAIYVGTKNLLQERLGLSSKEFTSLVNVVRSQFEVSLSQLLEEG